MRQRDPAAMHAAGWDVCLTVLDEVLAGFGHAARHRGGRGWVALRDDYAEVLGG